MRRSGVTAGLAGRLLRTVAVAIVLAGCGGKPSLVTFPVGGQLSLPEGLPVERAIITWHANADPDRLVSGVAGRDGRFELWSLSGSTRVRGAPAGEYRVRVTLPPDEEQREPAVLVIQETYLVSPGGGQFELVARRADDGT